jgi:Protein of unknown function (DUF3224)
MGSRPHTNVKRKLFKVHSSSKCNFGQLASLLNSRNFISYAVTLLFALSVTMASYAQQASSLVGDWSGESICAGNNASCHDEHVVYHVSVDAADSTKVTIAAHKIVDGKPEWMGDILLKYDAAKQTLAGDLQSPRYKGIWEFTVKGNTIEGTLSIFNPEKTIGRRIHVQRNETSQKEPTTVTQHATGTFDVKLTPQDDKSDDKSMGRMTIEKEWHGDMEGASRGQMLTGGEVAKGSGTYVAIEKFTGSIGGRKGTLIFQHLGVMNRGAADLTVAVVPDSGTDRLQGIIGKLTIKIEGGKHFYDFEYTIH